MDYENYNNKSKEYDSLRNIVGETTLLNLISNINGTARKQIKILDVGCGSGTYLEWFVTQGFKSENMYGIEPSREMLKIARERSKSKSKLIQGKAQSLPYPNDTFNIILCCQVLHHINKPSDRIKAINEMKRVLKPNTSRGRGKSMIILNITTPTQVDYSYWWSPLIPRATELIKLKFPPLEQLVTILSNGDTNDNICISIPPEKENVLMGQYYLDIYGPFKKEWRSGDSTWAIVSPKELSKCLQTIKTMIRDKKVKAFFRQQEKTRKSYGQTCYLIYNQPDL